MPLVNDFGQRVAWNSPGMNILQASVQKSVCELEDAVRYSPRVRSVLGYAKYGALKARRGTQAATANDVAWGIHALCSAIRYVGPSRLGAGIHGEVQQRLAQLDYSAVTWSKLVSKVADDPKMPKAILLKPWISERERGVIFSGFETNTAKLFRHLSPDALDEFSSKYTLIVAPTASPYSLLGYLVPFVWKSPVYSMISHAEELEDIRKMSPNYRTVELYASNWVEPNKFEPLPFEQRDIDIIMVASFGKVKRHHVLFEALATMPRKVNVTIVGQDQDGRTAEDIVRLAKAYGVDDQIRIVSNATYPVVSATLARAKISVLFSVNEGSSVIVTESLFAGTPMGLLERAHIGSRVFINEQTGRLFKERNLGQQLLEFLDSAPRMTPREWAVQNGLDCYSSGQRLNAALKTGATLDGAEWTHDIVTPCWAPDVQLARQQDAAWIAPERQRILERYGLTIGVL